MSMTTGIYLPMKKGAGVTLTASPKVRGQGMFRFLDILGDGNFAPGPRCKSGGFGVNRSDP